MSLFDELVDEAIQHNTAFAPLRVVVEKELLHHDIIREMSRAGLLSQLTFMGGTCLRACYGSNRLSEDLDFTGGAGFDKATLKGMADVLIKQLKIKYGLQIDVTEPTRETGNVDTWKLKVITRPQRRSVPTQRINIDICSVPSYSRHPSLLQNHYGVDMGTGSLLLQIESREEIFADKMVAFALRPNRIKNRDLWDIAWLVQQGVKLPIDLVMKKHVDHQQTREQFMEKLGARREELLTTADLETAFANEMSRFLPPEIAKNTVEAEGFFSYVQQTVGNACQSVLSSENQGFRM